MLAGTVVRDVMDGVWEVAASEAGPSVLLMVGLHPDEAGGVLPVLVPLLSVLLVRGTVVVAHAFPDVPPERHVGPERRDPNRSFVPEVLDLGDDWFRRRVRALASLATAAEFTVDVHRYTKPDGGVVAFPFDGRGVDLALRAEIPMIITELVPAVDGALALYAARAGRLPLVLEVGSKALPHESDRNALSAVLGVLRAIGVVEATDRIAPATSWPPGPQVLRLIRMLGRHEMSPELLTHIRTHAHMAEVDPGIAMSLDLPQGTRFVMVNPEADPAAYACVPFGAL